MKTRRLIGWIIDVVWLVGLAAYVLAGRDRAPFHGDESTLITMSHDYHTLIQQRAPQRLAYDPTPADPAAQSHRILNGPISPITIGLAWDLAGYSAGDLNETWVWEWTLDQNRALGHLPTEGLLHAARTPSALFTALSVGAVFGIARIAARARPAAYAASLIYATHPAVLLNGRRAIMEGPFFLFAGLAVLAALWIAQEQARKPLRRRVLVLRTAVFAATGGLAIASKHSAVIVIGALILALIAEPVVRRKTSPTPYLPPHKWRGGDDGQPRPRSASEQQGGGYLGVGRYVRRAARWTGAVVLMGLVFVALNPAWWRDPLRMPARVLDERARLLDGQVAAYGGYEGGRDQAAGLLRQLLWAGPQYYEVPGWDTTIRAEIDDYEASGLAGRRGGTLWGALLALALAAGMVWLVRRWRESAAWVVLVWSGITVLAVGVLTPLEWQRYYLPVQAPAAVVAGIGLAALVEWGFHQVRRDRGE